MRHLALLRAWTALLILVAVFGLTSPAGAQGELRVVDIEVVGNRVATPSLILGVSSIDKGSPLTPTIVQETIRRLYGLGIFRDVRLEAEQVTGGLKVTIVVDELPKLSGLEFIGNKEIKAKDLTEKLKLGIGGYISPYLIQQKEEEIKKLYAEKGYFQAKVEPSLEYAADSSEARLTYRIDEKSKVKVEQVVLTGNSRVEASSLIGKMRNRKRGFLKSSDFAQEKYEEDLTKVIEEYHKKGFIDAYLISDSIRIDTASNRMTIYLEVYEGPLYYFGQTSFNGNKEQPEENLRRALKYKEGEVFDAEEFEKSLMELYTAYQEIGHLHVRVDDERTTRQDSILDISFDITEGLPSHISMVKIVGNTKTKDKVIRREISVLPGQKFSRALLIRSVRDVMALNYFTNVEPVPIDLPSGDVDIEFKVEEKQTGQISAGAGYNSQDKLVGQLGLGIPNLFGNGQSLSFQLERGNRRNSFSISFTEPWLFGRPTLLGTDIYLTNRRWFEDYTEGRRGASVRVGRRLRWPDSYFRVIAGYRIEGNRFYDFSEGYRSENQFKNYYYYDVDQNNEASLPGDTLHVDIPDPNLYYPGSVLSYNEAWNTASRLSLTITRDSRNLPEFATKGSQISYTIENTGNILGGFWNYQKHSLKVAKFFPLIGKLSLATKVEYGVITSPGGDDRVLLSERFTPGGTAYDGIVRGYDDGSLTPDSIVNTLDRRFLVDVDAAGNPLDTVELAPRTFETRVRGKYMLVSNIELQYPIVANQLYALAFFDAGNSWLNREDMKPFTGLYKGAGLGFRIAIPGIGTIGFDFAYPLDKRKGQDQKWRPHFQIGTTFR